jgi:hypothetical protein
MAFELPLPYSFDALEPTSMQKPWKFITISTTMLM